MLAGALQILGGPEWLGWTFFAVGTTSFLVAAFFAYHRRGERHGQPSYSTVTRGRGKTRIRRSSISRGTYTDDRAETEIDESDV